MDDAVGGTDVDLAEPEAGIPQVGLVVDQPQAAHVEAGALEGGVEDLSNCEEDDEEEAEPTWCSAIRIVATVTGALAVFLLLAWSCTSSESMRNAAGILAAGSGLIFLLGFMLDCPLPCGMAKLTAAISPITIGAALLTYSGCCRWRFVALGFATLAAGLYYLYDWRRDCDKSWCAFWAEVLLAAGTITGYLVWGLDTFVPGIAACKPALLTIPADTLLGWPSKDKPVDPSWIVAAVTLVCSNEDSGLCPTS